MDLRYRSFGLKNFALFFSQDLKAYKDGAQFDIPTLKEADEERVAAGVEAVGPKLMKPYVPPPPKKKDEEEEKDDEEDEEEEEEEEEEEDAEE